LPGSEGVVFGKSLILRKYQQSNSQVLFATKNARQAHNQEHDLGLKLKGG